MKIGVFDSGLGGLFILKALTKELPEYDYVYLGDTQRVPYGNRSHETIYLFLEQAVDYLFKQNCELVIVACNTASAEALRKIQQHYLPQHYPKRRALGVIIPTVEEALAKGNIKRIGVLATQATVSSGAYVREITKLDSHVRVFQSPAPLLVPFIENDGIRWVEPALREYVKPLLRKNVDAIILGCTHYPILKRTIRKIAGVPIISQDECVPAKVKDYLKRHPDMEARLSRGHSVKLLVTDMTDSFVKLSRKWFGKNSDLVKVNIVKKI